MPGIISYINFILSNVRKVHSCVQVLYYLYALFEFQSLYYILYCENGKSREMYIDMKLNMQFTTEWKLDFISTFFYKYIEKSH